MTTRQTTQQSRATFILSDDNRPSSADRTRRTLTSRTTSIVTWQDRIVSYILVGVRVCVRTYLSIYINTLALSRRQLCRGVGFYDVQAKSAIVRIGASVIRTYKRACVRIAYVSACVHARAHVHVFCVRVCIKRNNIAGTLASRVLESGDITLCFSELT